MDSRSNQTDVVEPEQHAAEITPPPKLPAAAPRKALLMIGAVLLVLVVGAVIAMLVRRHDSNVLADETERESIPTVAVIHPTSEKPDEELVLPGSLQAFEESPIYARTNGYLLRWYKDIGSRVTKGELLADIDTPEVDQELMQTRATRQQIVAQMDLAKINSDRYLSLRKTDSVSQQEADQQASGYQQAKANLDAADANVRRLEELESFKHVYAPFSGVLTKRNVDPGALINAGGTGKELFDIARVDPLRVYVNVPQAYAPALKNGMEAWVSRTRWSSIPPIRWKKANRSTSLPKAREAIRHEVVDPGHRRRRQRFAGGMRGGTEVSASASSGPHGVQDGGSVACRRAERLASQRRMVGDLQRCAVEQLRAAIAEGQSVAGRSARPPEPGARAGAGSFGWTLPASQHRSQCIAQPLLWTSAGSRFLGAAAHPEHLRNSFSAQLRTRPLWKIQADPGSLECDSASHGSGHVQRQSGADRGTRRRLFQLARA